MPEDDELSELLPVISKDDELLYDSSRMTSVANALALYNIYYRDDEGNRINRMRLQLILDGYPPKDPKKQRAMGLADEANINVGILKGLLAEASRPLVDQINGVDRLVNIAWKQEADEDDDAYAKIVAEEHFITVTKDDEFDYHFRTQELVRQFVTHGVTVPYYPDSVDWRWDSEPLGKFLIAKDTKASESYVSVAFMERRVDPSYLAERYKNGNSKWDKEALFQAIKECAPERTATDTNYEDWTRAWKENDYYLDTLVPKIDIVHLWVRELNGKISKFVFAKKNPSGFLFKDEFAFDSTSQAFQFMTYGVGTTGTYHGIRGLAYDTVPLVLEFNRNFSSFLDALRGQGKMNLQAQSADALQNITVIEKGFYRIVPDGFTEMSAPQPNLAQGVIPGLQVIQGLLQQNAAPYAVDNGQQAFGGDARKTKAEIMAKIQAIAAASGGNSELFAKSWSRLMLEQLRRMLRKNYQEKEPGGKAIKDFRKRCKDKGVPDSFWDKIDLPACTAVPAVGAGSASQQMMIMERLLEFMNMGFFDAEGQLRVQRDAVRLLTGSNEAVKAYMGTGEIGRPGQDARNATFENRFMGMGDIQPVFPNDNHQVHAEVHLGASGSEVPTGSIADNIQLIEAAMQQNDEDTLLRLSPVLQLQLTHTEEHVARMQNAPLAARYREQLQQIAGTMVNVQRTASRIERERYKQQQQMMEEQAANDPSLREQREKDVGQQFWQAQELAESRMKLEENNQRVAQELAHKEQRHIQDMTLRDQEAAQKMAIEAAKAQSKMTTQTL